MAACARPTPEVPLEEQLDRARQILIEEGPAAALPRIQEALDAARTQRSREHEAQALGYLGTCYKDLAQLDAALRAHESALAIRREMGDRLGEGRTLNNIGLVYEARGDCAAALAHWDGSLRLFAGPEGARFVPIVRNNRGLCLDNLGRYDESLAEYEQALAGSRALGNEEGAALALGNIGGVYLLRGRYAEAERHYLEAYAIDERLKDRQAMALDLINLAEASLGLGQPSKAVDRYGRARALARAGGLSREQADADKGLGLVLQRLGRHDEARAALARALEAYERSALGRERVEGLYASGVLELALGDVAAAERAFTLQTAAAEQLGFAAGVTTGLLGRGDVERARRRPQQAERHYAEARRRAREAGDLAATAVSAAAEARVLLQTRRYADAISTGTVAVDAARRGGARLLEADALVALAAAQVEAGSAAAALAGATAAQRLADDAGDATVQWSAAYVRGQALERLGDRTEALAAYRRAVEVIETVRGRLASSRARSGYLDDKRSVYAALIRLLLALGRPDDAFGVAERLRASAFLDQIARSMLLGAGAGPGGGADLLARIDHLQRKLGERLAGAGADARGARPHVHAVHDELRQAERQWADRLDALATTNRAVAELRGRPLPSTRDLQRRLPAAAALLQFVVAERETMVFVLTREAIRARVVPVGADALRARVELLRGLLDRRDSSAWLGPARRLHADLIAPVEQAGWLHGIRRLLVVPHAELNYLPFAVLAGGPPDADRVLVEDYALALLPAASALVHHRPEAASRTEGLLALAPQPARLPHSELEVRAIGDIVGTTGQVLVGEAASEHRFKQLAPSHRILHLATHGFFDRLNPLLSGLELGDGPRDDGRLQVFEILELRLHAALVTLSACDTALGTGHMSDVPAGEEFVSLTRAFLAAGSRGVLASLWEVSDRATPALMQRFYGAARVLPVADALAEAQRQRYRAGGPHGHPYFWASFVVVGSADRLDPAHTSRTGP